MDAVAAFRFAVKELQGIEGIGWCIYSLNTGRGSITVHGSSSPVQCLNVTLMYP